MQNEIIKLTKKHENIRNKDKKPKPKELVKKIKNEINKYILIFKEYKKPINKNNNVQNNDVENNNEKFAEVEFKLRSQAFKYKDKSYFSDFDFDNLVERNEFDTVEVRKFDGITFDMFFDITIKLIEKIFISDLISMRGIQFDISIKVKCKWKQVVSELTQTSEFVIEEWLPWINTKNITITNAYEINMNSYFEYLLEKIERFQKEGSG